MMQQGSESKIVESDFLNVENKGKLWTMLQQNGAFNGINNNFFAKVREDFEVAAVKIEEQHRNKGKMEKSKLFLDFMIKRMQEYRLQSYTEPYTVDQIKKTRQEEFASALSQKQNEFNQFNSKPSVPDVSFADEENNNNGNVNDLLEKAIRDRENLTAPASGPAPGPAPGLAPGPASGPAPGLASGPAPGPAPGPASGLASGPAPGPAPDMGSIQTLNNEGISSASLSDILQQIMDKLNKIEELINEKNN